jgi:hypothetical protein
MRSARPVLQLHQIQQQQVSAARLQALCQVLPTLHCALLFLVHGVCRRNKEAVYKFSQVFQQEADQEAVYNGTTAALVCVAHTPAAAAAAAQATDCDSC